MGAPATLAHESAAATHAAFGTSRRPPSGLSGTARDFKRPSPTHDHRPQKLHTLFQRLPARATLLTPLILAPLLAH